MRNVRRQRSAVIAGVLLFSMAIAIISLPSIPRAFSQAPASFVFGAAGDFGANSKTAASLNALAGAGTNFFVALGDLSYDEVTPESAWCDFVKQRVGANYPFELLVGNHTIGGISDGRRRRDVYDSPDPEAQRALCHVIGAQHVGVPDGVGQARIRRSYAGEVIHLRDAPHGRMDTGRIGDVGTDHLGGAAQTPRLGRTVVWSGHDGDRFTVANQLGDQRTAQVPSSSRDEDSAAHHSAFW